MQPIAMQLSQKQETFSEVFYGFLKSSVIFEHFQEKDDFHRSYISEITYFEKHG